MTQEQLLDFGITLVGALKANTYKCSLEDGISMALEGTELSLASQEFLDEMESSPTTKARLLRMMEVERKLLHDQALALANAAVEYLAKVAVSDHKSQNEKHCRPNCLSCGRNGRSTQKQVTCQHIARPSR